MTRNRPCPAPPPLPLPAPTIEGIKESPQPRQTTSPTPEMAVPKRKTSPSRRGHRRSHRTLRRASPDWIEDKDSGELRRPHHIDLKTGEYGGRQILPPRER